MEKFNFPSDLIIGVSGIRGVCPGSLTNDIVYRLSRAFAKVCPPGAVVVSRDTRKSGLEFKKQVIAALTDESLEVLDADIATLPTTQIAVEETKAVGAIDITASHNPVEYNGLKFLRPDGIFIRQDTLDKIVKYTIENQFENTNVSNNKTKNICESAINWHINRLKKYTINGKKLTVAVDACNGAGSEIIPKLLKEINCDVIPIACNSKQPFPHQPEPTPANLEWTQNKLKNKKFDLGVVVDPDADRLVLIDEQNRLLNEETTLPLVMIELIAQGRKGAVAVNMSTSRMIEDIVAKHGIEVFRSKVGEINVVDMMKEKNCFFGGEGNGGVIDPQIHYGRDSLVGIIYIINLLRRTNKKISQLVEGLPPYQIKKSKISIENQNINNIYQKIEANLPEGKVNKTDGLRIDFEKSWVHIRPSSTEPVIRLIAEAPSMAEVDELINRVGCFLE